MTFETDLRSDFEDVLLEVGHSFSVERGTDTIDNMGRPTAVTETQGTIIGFMVDISKKDRQVAEMGLAVVGNRVLYTQHQHSTTSAGSVISSFVLQEGDVLIDRDSHKWKVVKILDEPQSQTSELYKKCVVQALYLEGSG